MEESKKRSTKKESTKKSEKIKDRAIIKEHGIDNVISYLLNNKYTIGLNS